MTFWRRRRREPPIVDQIAATVVDLRAATRELVETVDAVKRAAGELASAKLDGGPPSDDT